VEEEEDVEERVESAVSPRSQQQRNNGRETVIDLSPPSGSMFIDFSVGREVSTSPHNQQLQNPKNESKGAVASPKQQKVIPKREEPTSPQRQNQQGKGNKSKRKVVIVKKGV